MIPELYRVEKKQKNSHDTFTFELKPQEGSSSFKFLPGQFNMLYLFGAGEVPISMSGNPANSELITHTIRSVGAVTKGICALKPGDMLGVRGPFGTPWPLEKAINHDLILIAGGIGLVPLRPVLYHVLSNREKYGKLILLYGTRTPQDILYQNEIKRWQEKSDLEIHVTVDRALDNWRGNVGVVTNLFRKIMFNPKKTLAMICGPEIMMRFTMMELLNKGVNEENIFISMERSMKCALGFCGHCQLGPLFICKDGPVFCYNQVKNLLNKREL